MDRVLLMQHLVQAERHVTEGEYHVRRQRDLVEKLSKHGHDTRQAEGPAGGVRANPDLAQVRSRSAGRRTPARRILVVDDNEDAAESLATLLRMEGHEITASAGSTAALDLAPFRPDIASAPRQARSQPRTQRN